MNPNCSSIQKDKLLDYISRINEQNTILVKIVAEI